MRIQLIIFRNNHNHTRLIPEKTNYTGNYALETMILELLERHYGPKISQDVKKILTNTILEE